MEELLDGIEKKKKSTTMTQWADTKLFHSGPNYKFGIQLRIFCDKLKNSGIKLGSDNCIGT
jgi:hypothetical protein